MTVLLVDVFTMLCFLSLECTPTYQRSSSLEITMPHLSTAPLHERVDVEYQPMPCRFKQVHSMVLTRWWNCQWFITHNVSLNGCTYNGILFNLKREGSSDICYNMDKPCRHQAKENMSITKKKILYDFTLNYLEQSKSEAENRMKGPGDL